MTGIEKMMKHPATWSNYIMLDSVTQCKKILSTILIATFLSGCVYRDYNNPHIAGIIKSQGKALAGVEVSLANADHKIQTMTTDKKGYFSFNQQGEWNVFIPIGPQDRLTRWSIIITQGPMEITGYEDSRFGGIFSGYSRSDHIMLVCDVPLVKINTDDLDVHPVCKQHIDTQ